jgi:PhnB protein
MANYTTYIFSEDAKAQAEFYISALGGEINSIMTHGQLPDASEALKDKVIHLCVTVAGVSFFMSDSIMEHNPIKRGNNINLNLEFETEAEAHQAFNNLAEGGTVKDSLKPAFWGSLFGQLEDKYGVYWMVTTASKSS